MKTKKKIGDWIKVCEGQFYQIQNLPEVFLSNELATEEEVNLFLNKTEL